MPNGTTARVHVEALMNVIQFSVEDVFQVIRGSRGSIRPAARQALWRELAGVISQLESIRLWLDAGAPDISRHGDDGVKSKEVA